MKMKKNLFLRIALCLMIVVSATSGLFMGSGTAAKYAVAAEGNAVARVARFSVFVSTNGKSTASPGTTNFKITELSAIGSAPFQLSAVGMAANAANLFDMTSIAAHNVINTVAENTTATPNLTDFGPGTTRDIVNVGAPTTAATTGADVTDGTVIAPGVGGKLFISVFNNSEVAIKVTLTPSALTARYNGNEIQIDQIQENNLAAGIKWGNNSTATALIYDTPGAVPSSGTVDTDVSPVSAAQAYAILPPGTAYTFGDQTNGLWWIWAHNGATNPGQDAADTVMGIKAAEANGTGTQAAATNIFIPTSTGGTAYTTIKKPVYGSGNYVKLGLASYRITVEQVD
jgi:hypothetical protein